jgi:hypothetical protein
VGCAAEGVGLEDLAGFERSGYVTDCRADAPEANGELRRRVGMSGDSTQAPNHSPHCGGAYRIEQVSAKPPLQSLTPR